MNSRPGPLTEPGRGRRDFVSRLLRSGVLYRALESSAESAKGRRVPWARGQHNAGARDRLPPRARAPSHSLARLDPRRGCAGRAPKSDMGAIVIAHRQIGHQPGPGCAGSSMRIGVAFQRPTDSLAEGLKIFFQRHYEYRVVASDGSRDTGDIFRVELYSKRLGKPGMRA